MLIDNTSTRNPMALQLNEGKNPVKFNRYEPLSDIRMQQLYLVAMLLRSGLTSLSEMDYRIDSGR